MFPREHRLRQSKEILHTIRTGKKAHSGSFSCYFLENSATIPRVAVIAGLKVHKHAVVRNLVKRRIRAFLETLDLPNGNIVIQARSGADTYTFSQIEEQLLPCLKKLL